MTALSKIAERAGRQFEMRSLKAEELHEQIDSGVLREGSRRAYYREFKKVVEASDVILEVLDARDPMGCRNVALEEQILTTGRPKRLVLVLNKIDLVPREVVEGWLKYLRNFYPTIAFKANTQVQ